MIRARDFLVTHDHLYFAVVSDLIEDGRHLCTLRYARSSDGGVRKFDAASADEFLTRHYPRYHHDSKTLDVRLHGITGADIAEVLKPGDAAGRLLSGAAPDEKSRLARELLEYLLDRDVALECLGITGSLLPGFHNPDSDIDVIVYGLDAFLRVRTVLQQLELDDPAVRLTSAMWRDACERRGCELDIATFKRHELSKHNKNNCRGTKVDFSCIPDPGDAPSIAYPVVKLPARRIETTVTDDSNAFSYPSRYGIDHPEIREIVAYTATYTGQAFNNERIEARGPVERDCNGVLRMIVGTSRAAGGEFIRCLPSG